MLFIDKYDAKVPSRAIAINTTSRSDNWSKGLSPFFLGPVELYDGYVSQNVECGWQFSKCYKNHIDTAGNPTKEYFKWAQGGWNCKSGIRYPMGKGAVPEYSYWDGKKLSYVEARKQIYIPLYANAVIKSEAFAQLKELYETTDQDIFLLDFDGYNHKKCNMSYKEVINCSYRKMGHAFVIAMILENFIQFV